MQLCCRELSRYVNLFRSVLPPSNASGSLSFFCFLHCLILDLFIEYKKVEYLMSCIRIDGDGRHEGVASSVPSCQDGPMLHWLILPSKPADKLQA